MGKKKRKRSNTNNEENKRSIHPRNRYADNPPDFSLLASLYPSFSPFVFFNNFNNNNKPYINWTDFNATRELTRVLLLHDHSLNWWIPDGQLCPTVPNRSNYIHWIEDLLASDIIEKNNVDKDKVRGFDIGTGANCIYPLLGASLLGWSFVGSDITDVAIEWAEKNVKSNPHISDLIEIRRVNDFDPSNKRDRSDNHRVSENHQKMEDCDDLDSHESREFVESTITNSKGSFGISCSSYDEIHGYHGPSVLLGVVKEGETFDFCMCNPPFFESMEESGLNPKTSCGGTPKEMVCPGGERSFINRIIEDSVVLKQSFRWYTSMVGKKSNLKVLMSKLREVGVTIVKTTEFVQGKTSRWGLAWSFMSPSRKFAPSNLRSNNNPSFMLEGLNHRTSAFDVLQAIQYFFDFFGASCKLDASSFTIEVSASNDHCDTILKTDAKKLDEPSFCLGVDEASKILNCSISPMSLSFRISVFQQIPGTLLVKASSQLRDSPLSGVFTSVFQQLEEFLKHKFCSKKARC